MLFLFILWNIIGACLAWRKAPVFFNDYVEYVTTTLSYGFSIWIGIQILITCAIPMSVCSVDYYDAHPVYGKYSMVSADSTDVFFFKDDNDRMQAVSIPHSNVEYSSHIDKPQIVKTYKKYDNILIKWLIIEPLEEEIEYKILFPRENSSE
jgi:hypothetical protein